MLRQIGGQRRPHLRLRCKGCRRDPFGWEERGSAHRTTTRHWLHPIQSSRKEEKRPQPSLAFLWHYPCYRCYPGSLWTGCPQKAPNCPPCQPLLRSPWYQGETRFVPAKKRRKCRQFQGERCLQCSPLPHLPLHHCYLHHHQQQQLLPQQKHLERHHHHPMEVPSSDAYRHLHQSRRPQSPSLIWQC